ncbi:MAG: hypothetical protein LCH56_15390 [Proteobacteria bacterium]|nr:hypothetical protein [Pseudomonadota bacterium]
MGQDVIHTLKSDIALLQGALENVQSPAARATLTEAIEALNNLMWADAGLAAYPLAPEERRSTAGHPMFDAPVDWF